MQARIYASLLTYVGFYLLRCFKCPLGGASPVSGSDIAVMLSTQVVRDQETNVEEKHNREH